MSGGLPDRETIYQVSARAYERSIGCPERFEHEVRADDSVKGLNPFLSNLFVKLAFILFEIWKSQSVNLPTAIKDPQLPENFEREYAMGTVVDPIANPSNLTENIGGE